MSYATAIGGYAALAVAAGAVYYFSTQKKQKRNAATPAKAVKIASAAPELRKEGKAKAKKQRAKDFQGSAATTTEKSSTTTTTGGTGTTKDEISNDEFARTMASLKEGSQLNKQKNSKSHNQNKPKSVKQSKALTSDFDDVAGTSTTSSDTEAAMFPALSTAAPAVQDTPIIATSVDARVATDAALDATGVADMLEPVAPGPSVLRLTDTDKAKSNGSAKPAKAPAPVETKKQRQNRKKAEAARAAREEAEQLRKVQMEAQRRQARIAEGRAAKDGSAFMANVNGTNAWTQNGTKTEAAPVAPLDTFDASIKKEPVTKPAAQDNWIASLPSEEEQIEMLKEETEWNTVPSSKAKKAKKQQQQQQQQQQQEENGHEMVANKVSVSVASVVNGGSKSATSYGSFAALSTNETEEEWDV